MRRYVLLSFFLALVLAGCGSGSASSRDWSTSSTTVTVQSVSVSPTSLGLALGQAQQVRATAAYSDGTSGDITSTVTWATDTPRVASVGTAATSNPGVITGLGGGTATVTATDATSGFKGTVTVTVTDTGNTLQSITITPNVTQLAIHTQMQMTATGTFTSGPANITPQVTWNSSNPAAVSVNNAGVVTGVDLGTAKITATDPNTGIDTFIFLTTTGAALKSIAVTPQTPTLAVNGTQQMTATATFSDGTVQDLTPFATWASGNDKVATVTTLGLVTAVAAGNIPITATDAFTNIQGQTTLTVK